MTNRMECSITDGPQPDDEQIIPEPEFEEHPDPSLNDTLRDIARLSTVNDILDEVYTGLSEGMYRKRQG